MVHERLEDNDVVHTVLRSLDSPQAPPLELLPEPLWHVITLPASRVMHLATIGLLPRALRDKLDVEWGRREALELRAVAAVSRRATPLMPAWLRRTGPGYLRAREDAIAHGQFA